MPWKVSGQYYEICSCDFVCPCVPGQMAVSPSKGSWVVLRNLICRKCASEKSIKRESELSSNLE